MFRLPFCPEKLRGALSSRLAMLVGFLLGAAFGPAQTPGDSDAFPPNTLSAAERQAGWRLLFDGATLTGWRGFRQAGPPSRGWVVEDGCLRLLPRSRAGDLVTEAEFDDFELQWE